jgi:hypothetical protein
MSHNNYDHQCIGAGIGTPTSFEITVIFAHFAACVLSTAVKVLQSLRYAGVTAGFKSINLESCECVVDGNESDTTYLTNAALNITGESTNNFCREMGITSYL